MSKLPYMPFYPGDYLKDTRGLPAFVKGVWMDMICYLWEAKRRGRETLPLQVWSQRCGVSEADMILALDTLRLQRTCDVKFLNENEIKIRSRRMVRDEEKRTEIRARVTKHRENKGKSAVLRNAVCNANVMPCNGDISEVRSHISEVILREEKKEEENIPQKRKPPKKPAVSLPEDFLLTGERNAYAMSKGVANPGNEFEHFLAHHRKNDSRFVDWNAAWQTWVLNAVKWAKQGSGNGQTKSPYIPPVKCTWQVKHGHSLKACNEIVEPDLTAKGGKTCRAHLRAKIERERAVARLRGDAPVNA